MAEAARNNEEQPDATIDALERRLSAIGSVGKPVVVQRASLPAPVRKAATAVAVGAALQIGASLAVRYLAGQAGKQAGATAATKALRAAGRNRPARRETKGEVEKQPPRDDTEMISELLVVRRIWMRRRD